MKKVVLGVMILLLGAPGFVLAQRQGPRIALLDSSENTTVYFFNKYGEACDSKGNANDLGANEYRRYFLGWKFVLDGERYLPDTDPDGDASSAYDYLIIHDDDITNGTLNNVDFAVLILSNIAVLTDKQERAIQHWVLQGGHLIATYGSGYRNIITDLKQEPDGLKSQSGGTFGIHQLWHDPVSRAFGSNEFFPTEPRPGIDVRITKFFGPTDPWVPPAPPALPYVDLDYGAEANLLTPRPELFRTALAFLTFDFHLGAGREMTLEKRMYPAILLTKMAKSRVVYFAFAPEFILSLAYDLAGHCPGDGNYPPFQNCPLGVCGNPAPGVQTGDFPNGFTAEPRLGDLTTLMDRTIDYVQTGQ